MSLRARIRFAKQDDLRWISHRDLMRLWERLFRRANVPLARSEGFHPKPKMNFPSALAVGIAGLREVIEIDLAGPAAPPERHAGELTGESGQPWTEDLLRERCTSQAPLGLIVNEVRIVELPSGKARVYAVQFSVEVPEEMRAGLEERIAAVLARDACVIRRAGRAQPLDLRPLIEELEIRGNVLAMRLAAADDGSARPREVLELLDLALVEHTGAVLTRDDVLLRDEAPAASRKCFSDRPGSLGGTDDSARGPLLAGISVATAAAPSVYI